MSGSRPNESNQGFALVDVLVALAVTGLAGSVLVGLFVFIESSIYRTRELAQADRGTAVVSRILRQLTEDGYSVRASHSGVVHPHGTDRAFVIATTGPRILGLSRPALFTLESEIAGGKTRIVLRWKDPDTGQEHAEIVGALVDRASFSYLGRDSAFAERSWKPTWEGKRGRLEAIKLTLSSRDMPTPIELVAPVRASVPLQCIRNPHQPGCSFGEE